MSHPTTQPTAPAPADDGGRSEQKRPEIKRLLSDFTRKHYAMAADEWKEGASESSVRRHYDEAGAAEDALVAEMDRLLAVAASSASVAELRAALEEQVAVAKAELAQARQKYQDGFDNVPFCELAGAMETLLAHVGSALATRRPQP